MSSKPPRRESRTSEVKSELPTSSTPPERKTLNYSVAMTVALSKYLESLAAEFELGSGAEVVRKLIEARRTWFALPPYQAARLEEELKARKLSFLTYVQEVLAREYEALSKKDAEKPRT